MIISLFVYYNTKFYLNHLQLLVILKRVNHEKIARSISKHDILAISGESIFVSNVGRPWRI